MAINAVNIDANLSVEQKFAKALINLRLIRPFYSAIYEVMEKRKSSIIDTMGVGTNYMLYNYEFVDKTPLDELMFIILHEIGHIGLQHVARRENRDPELWNIAGDLYINHMLSVEFCIKPGECIKVNNVDIRMPRNLLYCSSIDLDVDYTELIYEDLEKQGKKNGYLKSKTGSNLFASNNSNQSADGDGEEGDENGQGTPSNSNNQGKQKQSSPVAKPMGGKYVFKYTGSGQSKDHWGRSQDEYRDFSIAIDPSYKLDLCDDGKDQSVKQQEADKIVADATVRVDMSSQECGNGTGSLHAQVKRLMKSQVDWRKILRKYLIAATTTDSSFSKPDKRMYYQNSIYPGQVCDEENTIKGLKVCIDTSGSISDEDLSYFFGQVYSLIKQFKIDAELIYWDTEVQSTGAFQDFSQFERVDVSGRGGTDPAVVFNYFDSKKCKVKPVVTLMFTDGWFSTDGITARQRRKYRDTIWIMTRGYDKSFEPPFGKLAFAKFS